VPELDEPLLCPDVAEHPAEVDVRVGRELGASGVPPPIVQCVLRLAEQIELEEAGVDVIELGVPFSDPMAARTWRVTVDFPLPLPPATPMTKGL
jgi:hypothetical protein